MEEKKASNQKTRTDTFGSFAWKVISLHMITYMIAGMIFSTVFNYRELFKTGSLSLLMKDFSSPWIYAGPSLQVIRGVLYALAIWPFYDFIFPKAKGWSLLWLLFLGFAIFGTAGASPGSLEGFIYTRISIYEQLAGLPEVMLQTLAFSFLLHYWCNHHKKYFTIISILGVALILIMGAAALTIKK